ncbi:alpha/beta hydrolase [Streptococcus hongkongensis]
MKKSLTGFFFIMMLLLLITLGILGETYVHEVTAKKVKLYNSRMVPTIFVPGSGATINRFNDMLDYFNQKGAKHSILKVEVSKKGTLTYQGAIASNDNHPFIVIAFQNNADGYANIKQQAKWLAIAMADLQEHYHFKRFNAVGHSNGGLNWTLFLENYYGVENFQMDKLATIGTPYNFEESNLSNQTQMLKDLRSDNVAIPKNLIVYNLAGTDSFDADKIVPFASVVAGRYIFQNVAKHYTQVTVTGTDATHSDLPSNPEVMQYIQEKLISALDKPEKAMKQ